MATKTANFNMRMEEQKKSDVEGLYKKLGMTLPQAVNVFFSQSLLVGGLPFDVKLQKYNKETEAAMQEAREISSGKSKSKTYKNLDELVKELG